MIKDTNKRILFWMYKQQVEQTHNFTRFAQVGCTIYVSYLFNFLLIDCEFNKKITGTAHLYPGNDK